MIYRQYIPKAPNIVLLKTSKMRDSEKKLTLPLIALASAFIVMLWSPKITVGQRHEVGLFFGSTSYFGDINPTLVFSMPRIAAGGLYRFNIDNHIALRVNGMIGSVASSDGNVQHNTIRNLSFRSSIMEASLKGEVNYFPFVPGDLKYARTPYVFGGIGVFRFNPKAQLNGEWIALNPLGTEGQGSPLYPDRTRYSLTSVNLLFGLGFKFNITRQFSGAFEWGMRRTSTDYLDDVSTTFVHPDAFANNPDALALYDRSLHNRGNNTHLQRGNPNVNDWYSFAGFVLTYRIKNRSRISCPAYN